MKTDLYPEAHPLDSEAEILERLSHLVKPGERKAVSIIGVANAQGQARLRIVAYTEAEEEAAIGVLERRNFRETLGGSVGSRTVEGTAEIIHAKHPDFDYLFVPAK